MSNDTPTTSSPSEGDDHSNDEVRELAEMHDELGAELLAEVPQERTGFWTDIDEDFVAVQLEATGAPTVSAHSGTDISTGDRTANAVADRRDRVAAWPLALAAALLLIAGVFVGTQLLPSDGETIDAGFADGTGTLNLADIPGPQMNVDHWHAVYGVWDCTANDGAGDWIEAFQSTRDDSGIHSHGDGLIHIHPFFEFSAGQNAQLGLWANEMGITISDNGLKLDDDRVLLEQGSSCNGEPAVLHLRRWTLDVQLLADPTTPPIVVTQDLNSQRFFNDREVWTLAFAPLSADIPLPPQERFDTMRQSVPVFDADDLPDEIRPGIALPLPEGAPVPSYEGPIEPPNIDGVLEEVEAAALEAFAAETEARRSSLASIPSMLDSSITGPLSPPQGDVYMQFLPAPSPADTLQAWLDETETELLPSQVQRYTIAETPHAASELFRFDSTNDGRVDCSLLVLPRDASLAPFSSLHCVAPDQPIATHYDCLTSQNLVLLPCYVALNYEPANGMWMVVELDDGRSIVANLANGNSAAIWPGDLTAVRVAVFDSDLNELWSETP